MPELSNVEYLRTWFRQCPAINAENRFGIDYLPKEPTEYAIYAVPSTIVFRENVLGEDVPADIQTLDFIFASKETYGADSAQNAANLLFYEEIVMWIIEQNAARNLPTINGGRVRSIVPTLTAYPAEVGVDAAKYQIQLKITYKRTNA